MTITTTAEVAEYGAAVRLALADLTVDQQGVLEGLDEHLAEVAAEGDAGLVSSRPARTVRGRIARFGGAQRRPAPPHL